MCEASTWAPAASRRDTSVALPAWAAMSSSGGIAKPCRAAAASMVSDQQAGKAWRCGGEQRRVAVAAGSGCGAVLGSLCQAAAHSDTIRSACRRQQAAAALTEPQSRSFQLLGRRKG